MSGYVSSVKFCQMTGMDRGNLHKRLKKEGVATFKGPYITESGVQDVTWIPLGLGGQGHGEVCRR
jgi:hypothetical protein